MIYNSLICLLIKLFVHRGEVEKDMHFLGLLMMKNLVKPESAKVINILRKANIRSIMVTGEECFCIHH